MKRAFEGWHSVSQNLHRHAADTRKHLNEGQRASLRAIADRIRDNGLILADEVGMGKTRIAVALAHCVIEAGGRVAVLVPPGLGYQWLAELRAGEILNVPDVLRSLNGFLSAWEQEAEASRSWFNCPLLLISHAFAAWRLGAKSGQRTALLPALYAEWRKKETGRYPRDYREEKFLEDPRVLNAACAIQSNIETEDRNTFVQTIKETIQGAPWPTLKDPSKYSRGEDLRPLLEGAVGLGLGTFDLIIIDEAHKSRGEESGLSQLLNFIILPSNEARRFAMTATPVELHIDQWRTSLARIGVRDDALRKICINLENYKNAVQRVRRSWRSSEEARDDYVKASREFQDALCPYLLRRDKREDEAVIKFTTTGQNFESYRHEKEIKVRLEALPQIWRQAICAAEALSFVASNANDPTAKRVRLTSGSGHGFAKMMDPFGVEKIDISAMEGDPTSTANFSFAAEDLPPVKKRESRIQWWKEKIERSGPDKSGTLFDHPAILAAANAIEEYTCRKEKVLVFGRFTRPMRALTDLLNAREMLRCLQEGESWPQSKIPSLGDEDERPAVKAARRQLDSQIDPDEIDALLTKQYQALEDRRRLFRSQLFDLIAQGLNGRDANTSMLLEQAKHSDNVEATGLLVRAVDELIGPAVDPNPEHCARAFSDLMVALRDNEEIDATGDIDEDEAGALWPEIERRLKDEYSFQRGTFARLMYGETKPSTRRMLQLAFNRLSSFPRVLVVQSTVGREGLNLHEACRVVVLLHPEWNPGVVEQQIGRVDRVGSLWSQELEQALKSDPRPEDLPRIEIRPVVFEGTYDEHHWKVLNERWDDLRAQLHGVIVPQRLRAGASPAEMAIIKQLDDAGPNFSPSARAG